MAELTEQTAKQQPLIPPESYGARIVSGVKRAFEFSLGVFFLGGCLLGILNSILGPVNLPEVMWANLGDALHTKPHHSGLGDLCLVPVTREAAAEMDRLRTASDGLGLDIMTREGRLLAVNGGTDVRVIDRAIVFPLWKCCDYQVRFTSGPLLGKTGWVHGRELSRSPGTPAAVMP